MLYIREKFSNNVDSGGSGSVSSAVGAFAVDPTFSRVLSSTVNVTRALSNAVSIRPVFSSHTQQTENNQTQSAAGANPLYRGFVLNSARSRRRQV